jgi:hypothetical protein
MLGFVGIIVVNNAIQNTVQIVQEIERGKRYMVKFMNTPSFHRVCSIEEVQGWLLFPEEKDLNAWVQSQAGAPPPPKGDGGKAGAKKPGAKQSGTRKPSGANKKDQ